jgi:hypothetical protein
MTEDDHGMTDVGSGTTEDGSVSLRRRRFQPCAQHVDELRLGLISHPRHITVRSNQHGGWSCDRTDRRKLPRTIVFRVNCLNAIFPWSDVERSGRTEVPPDPQAAATNTQKTGSATQ